MSDFDPPDDSDPPDDQDPPDDLDFTEAWVRDLGSNSDSDHIEVDGVFIPEGAETFRGGQAYVKRVVFLQTGRWCALKYPAVGKHEARFEETRARLRREGQVLASLDHPHLPRFVKAGVAEDERPYLLMDWVEGADLGQLPLSSTPDQKLSVLQGVLAALKHCHSKGVLHRDIKPANIRVNADYRAVLLDFGLGKIWTRRRQDYETATDVRAGTDGFMAPEMLHEGTALATPKCDVYSMGVVMREQKSGLQEWGAPGQWQRLIDFATAADPAQRYHDGAELYEAFMQWRAGFVTPAPRPRSLASRAFAAVNKVAVALVISFFLSAQGSPQSKKLWSDPPIRSFPGWTHAEMVILRDAVDLPLPGEERALPDDSLSPLPAKWQSLLLRLRQAEAAAGQWEERAHVTGAESLVKALLKDLAAERARLQDEPFHLPLTIMQIRAYLAGVDCFWIWQPGTELRQISMADAQNNYLQNTYFDPAWELLESLKEQYGKDEVFVLELQTKFLLTFLRANSVRPIEVGNGRMASLAGRGMLRELRNVRMMMDDYRKPADLYAVVSGHIALLEAWDSLASEDTRFLRPQRVKELEHVMRETIPSISAAGSPLLRQFLIQECAQVQVARERLEASPDSE